MTTRVAVKCSHVGTDILRMTLCQTARAQVAEFRKELDNLVFEVDTQMGCNICRNGNVVTVILFCLILW